MTKLSENACEIPFRPLISLALGTLFTLTTVAQTPQSPKKSVGQHLSPDSPSRQKILSQAPSQKHHSSNNPTPFPALNDVQDHLDTIDQAGLYDLIKIALSNTPAQIKNSTNIPPIKLYENPSRLRATPVTYEFIINPQVITVNLDRPLCPGQQLYYVAAQIPFGQNLRFPAIILTLEKPQHLSIDPIAISGYFYMILRVPTQQQNPKLGPTQLDFLVFLTQKIETISSKNNLNQGGPTIRRLAVPITTVTLLGVWVFLKNRIKNKKRTLKTRTFPRGDHT